MSGILAGKCQMKCVTSVASDNIRIFTVPETPDMNISAGWFCCEKLTYDTRDQSKTKDYEEIK
jgi:hypothetical protein